LSYRSRLTLFFGLIVVVPMIAVFVLALQLSSQSRTGKADARLAGDLQTALVVYRDDQELNRRKATEVARDSTLRTALERQSSTALKSAVARLIRDSGLAELVVSDPGGRVLAGDSSPTAVAAARLTLRGPKGDLGSLTVSATPGSAYADEVHRLTGADVVLSDGSSVLVTSRNVQGAPPDLGSIPAPSSGDVQLPQGERRSRTIALSGAQHLTLLDEVSAPGLIASQPLLASVLFVFFLLAVALIVPLLRDLQRLHGMVEQQAVTDELTGLSNQRRFRELMAKEVERAQRFSRPLSLLMLDIDDFKEINDTYGHLQGDRVLAEVAALLRGESRGVDEPARYGGEEFAIALPETNVKGALELAERIRKRIEQTPIALDGRSGTVKVRASVGVAGSPGTEPDVSSLIAAADRALYKAKRAGKNQSGSAGGESDQDGERARRKKPPATHETT
jgi:diguanylate cyclase (GGDEF)-like protein